MQAPGFSRGVADYEQAAREHRPIRNPRVSTLELESLEWQQRRNDGPAFVADQLFTPAANLSQVL
jgi:hypothetical protein